MSSSIFRIKQNDAFCIGFYSHWDYRSNPTVRKVNLIFGTGKKVKEFKTYELAHKFILDYASKEQQNLKIVEYREFATSDVDYKKIDFCRDLVKRYDYGISELLSKLDNKTDGKAFTHILVIPKETYKTNQKKIRGLDVKKTDFVQSSSCYNTYWAFKDPDKLLLVRLTVDSKMNVEKINY